MSGFTSKTIKSLVCLLLLTTTLVSSARILDEITPQVPISDDTTPDDNVIAPVVAPITTQPSGQLPVPTTISPGPEAPSVVPVPDIPDANATPPTNPSTTTSPLSNVPQTTNPSTTTTTALDHPTLSFFMHDILGGSHPSARVVTGIVANSDANNLPFSKPSNPIFPINGGVPLNTINGVINNNNVPTLVGLNGGTPSNAVIQNNGNNIVNTGGNQAFVSAGQLPSGVTLQQLMFGTVTVVDNELTEGHELGSAVLGKAQGFYLASSADGSSHTLMLTALFHGHDQHEIEDTVSFFGVHRTATPISHIAIIGGTGKHENAKGYATIETLPHEDQHTTDGLETITHFTLYLTP